MGFEENGVFPKRLLGTALFAGFLALFFLLPSFAELYTDWLWFAEVGYQQVFLGILNARLALGLAAFVGAFAILYLNIRVAQTALKQRAFTIFGPQGPRTVALDMARLRPLFYLGAAIGAALIAMYASGRWEVAVLALNAVPFGKT